MNYTIQSKKLGRAVTFFVSGADGYIYVDLNGREGTLGNQICAGGRLSGETLRHSYKGTSDAESLAVFGMVCRAWWRGYLRDLRLYNTGVFFDDTL